jgi:dTDP-4-amino-4,6-dideoxygalactose transaminase
MSFPLIRMRDLAITDVKIKDELVNVLLRVCDHGQFILGKEVFEFESLVCRSFGYNTFVATSTGSSALYLALKALGIGRGDEVITTPMSWLVSSSAICLTGATPVFVDVDANYNLCPDRVGQAIGAKTKAVLAVHYYGRLCQIERLRSLCDQHGLFLVEDSAQAVGARRGESFAGSFGDAGCLSFSPMKVLRGLGDGGGISFPDSKVADLARSLRHCATNADLETCHAAELKHNLDALDAGFISVFLKRLDRTIESRSEIADRYIENLSVLPHLNIQLPSQALPFEHTWYDFVIELPNRDAVLNRMRSRGVEVKVRHPLLISDQAGIDGRTNDELVNAKRATSAILCLPIYNGMPLEQVDMVCDVLVSVLK